MEKRFNELIDMLYGIPSTDDRIKAIMAEWIESTDDEKAYMFASLFVAFCHVDVKIRLEY